MSCPIGLLESGISAILTGYLKDNPEVRLMLDATNRRVDVIQEGLDLAIRVRRPPLTDSELVIRRLGNSNMILVASPKFLSRHGKPTTLEEASQLPTVALGNISERFEWTFYDKDGNAISAQHKPRLATDDLATLRIAALDGIGIVEIPRELVHPNLEDRSLAHVLPDCVSIEGIVHAVYPTRRGMVPAIRRLLDTIATEFPAVWSKRH
jgi:DNA-binding transcriptional LysR family regulator